MKLRKTQRSKPGMKLKIRQPKLSPHSCQVWLDDKEITHSLQAVTVAFCVDDATHAELRILIDDLDLDADTLATLQAHVEGKPWPKRNGAKQGAQGEIRVKVTADTRDFDRAIRRVTNSLEVVNRKAAFLEMAAHTSNTKEGDG